MEEIEKRIQSTSLPAAIGDSWYRSLPESPEALDGAVERARDLSGDARQIQDESASLVNLFHGVRVSRFDLVDVERLRRACAEVLADLISVRQCLEGRSRAAASAARRRVRKDS